MVGRHLVIHLLWGPAQFRGHQPGDAPGRPILYRTTPVFLRSFGLSSLEELPPLPESGLNREEGQPW